MLSNVIGLSFDLTITEYSSQYRLWFFILSLHTLVHSEHFIHQLHTLFFQHTVVIKVWSEIRGQVAFCHFGKTNECHVFHNIMNFYFNLIDWNEKSFFLTNYINTISIDNHRYCNWKTTHVSLRLMYIDWFTRTFGRNSFRWLWKTVFYWPRSNMLIRIETLLNCCNYLIVSLFWGEINLNYLHIFPLITNSKCVRPQHINISIFDIIFGNYNFTNK